jgi:ferric enterobactin receptor
MASMVRRWTDICLLVLPLLCAAAGAWAESAPSAPEAKSVAQAAASGSSAGTAAAAPSSTAAPSSASRLSEVISLPEEVVHAGGLRFVDDGGVRFTVPAHETARLPGGFADPTRYLQSLPGVGNDSDFDGLLFVRGAAADQTRIYLDQVSVSDPYHFGGVVSFLNTDVIDQLDFVPSGYAADYGDALGGVVRVRRRIGNLQSFHASGTLSVTTLNGTVEGPTGNAGTGSWLLAARRSYLDKLLGSRTVGHAVLPSYFDVDGRLYQRFGTHDLRLGVMRSGDGLSARMSDEFTFAPADSAGLTWDRVLTLVSLNWEHASGPWCFAQTAAYSWRDQEAVLHGTVPQTATGQCRTFDWRGDATRPLAGVTWAAGAQVTQTHLDYHIDFNRLSLEQPDRRSAPRSPLDTVRTVSDFEGRNLYVAGYAQATFHLADSAVTATLGARLERATRSGQTEPTPRLNLTWRTPWRVVANAAAGSYRQFPSDRIEADPQIGSAELRAERARHLTLGLALPLRGGGRLSVEAYHKRLNDLVAYVADAAEGDPRFASTGSGTARGVEFLAHLPGPRWSVWAAYTLGEVRYRDRTDLPEYAPAQDLRHILSFAGRCQPSAHWTFGVKWRAYSGRPYTPIVGRENVSEFVEGVEWIPVQGSYNSARFPWYHRLDVRAEREFRLAGLRASAFLEVINLYGRHNLYDYRYVDGFGRAVPVTMLPMLPTLGLTVSL